MNTGPSSARPRETSAREACGVLANMSAPSKTVVRYSGLVDARKPDRPGKMGLPPVHDANEGVFGRAACFSLPPELRDRGAREIARIVIGNRRSQNPEKDLRDLIEKRAEELPLPDGAVVVPHDPHVIMLETDALSVLAVLTKSSDRVWLRSKTPRLSALGQRNMISLLIPPAHVARLEEMIG